MIRHRRLGQNGSDPILTFPVHGLPSSLLSIQSGPQVSDPRLLPYEMREKLSRYSPREAAIIGQVTEEHPGTVVLRSQVGGKRIVDMLSGEQLPRIC